MVIFPINYRRIEGIMNNNITFLHFFSLLPFILILEILRYIHFFLFVLSLKSTFFFISFFLIIILKRLRFSVMYAQKQQR